MDVSAANAGAGDDGRVAIGPVIAAVGTVAVARGADALLRAAAELADRHDQRVFQKPALVHVDQQAGKPLVEHRPRSVAHPVGKIGMVVPRVIVGVGHLGPDDLDDLRAGLDQAAGQQAALAERVAAVKVTGLGRLGLDVERLASPARDDQREARS